MENVIEKVSHARVAGNHVVKAFLVPSPEGDIIFFFLFISLLCIYLYIYIFIIMCVMCCYVPFSRRSIHDRFLSTTTHKYYSCSQYLSHSRVVFVSPCFRSTFILLYAFYFSAKSIPPLLSLGDAACTHVRLINFIHVGTRARFLYRRKKKISHWISFSVYIRV